MKKLLGIMVLTGAVLGWHVTAGFTNESSPEYQSALSVAKVVDTLIRSTRAKYTKNVVSKLKKDGTGAAVNAAALKGFAPLPAQFVRAIAFDVAIKQKKSGEDQFALFLRSRWNLNTEQGIQDDFEKAGWQFLVRQQEEALKGGKALKNIKWKPFVRVETLNGNQVLRYFSADPGSAIACVKCHNAQEKKPEVQQRRKAQGVEVGKTFRMHELMGALSINVPLSE